MMLVPFLPLHSLQSGWMFFISLVPALLTGMMWSAVSLTSSRPQHKQRLPYFLHKSRHCLVVKDPPLPRFRAFLMRSDCLLYLLSQSLQRHWQPSGELDRFRNSEYGLNTLHREQVLPYSVLIPTLLFSPVRLLAQILQGCAMLYSLAREVRASRTSLQSGQVIGTIQRRPFRTASGNSLSILSFARKDTVQLLQWWCDDCRVLIVRFVNHLPLPQRSQVTQ